MAQQGHAGDQPCCPISTSPHALASGVLWLLAQLTSWSCALSGVDLEVALNHTPLGTCPSLACRITVLRNYVLFVCFSPRKSDIPKGTLWLSLWLSLYQII